MAIANKPNLVAITRKNEVGVTCFGRVVEAQGTVSLAGRKTTGQRQRFRAVNQFLHPQIQARLKRCHAARADILQPPRPDADKMGRAWLPGKNEWEHLTHEQRD